MLLYYPFSAMPYSLTKHLLITCLDEGVMLAIQICEDTILVSEATKMCPFWLLLMSSSRSSTEGPSKPATPTTVKHGHSCKPAAMCMKCTSVTPAPMLTQPAAA